MISAESGKKITLADSNAVYKLKLLSKDLINHDVIKFVFELPSQYHILGTKSGQHYFIIKNINGNEVKRKYTPVDLEDHTGTTTTIIKV